MTSRHAPARRHPHAVPRRGDLAATDPQRSTSPVQGSRGPSSGRDLLALQSMAGNRAATTLAGRRGANSGARAPGGPAPVARQVVIQREVVGIGGGERLEIADGLSRDARAARTKEGRDIIKEMKTKYGITISSKRSAKAILKDYFPGRKAPKEIRDQIQPAPWRIEELRNVRTALERYAPVLGKERKKSSDAATAGSKQSMTSIGKVNNALSPDASQPHGVEVEQSTLGESFKSSKNIAFFEALATSVNHNFIGDAGAQQRGTMGHELCHALIQPRHLADFVARFDYWQDARTRVADANRVSTAAPKVEAPITRYGSTNAGEDLAEVAKFYFEEPARLKAGNGQPKGTPGNPTPERLDFFDRIVLSWTKTPDEVAQARYRDMADDFLARAAGEPAELIAAKQVLDTEFAAIGAAGQKRLNTLRFQVAIKYADLVTGD